MSAAPAPHAPAPPPKTRKKRRRLRERFDLKKALFILPNAFTVSSIFCGLYAILNVSRGGDMQTAMYQSAIAIFFSGFFDTFDGRVARMTRTQSEFGVQMDSLADVISFGVAPAVLLFHWSLHVWDTLGLVCAFVFAACGTIRLARFNVLAARGVGSSRFFVGLPIPLAAAMVVALVVAHHNMRDALGDLPRAYPGAVAAIAIGLGLLMVSNVHYRTFKDFRPSQKNIAGLSALLLLAVAGSVFLSASATLVLGVAGYIGAGLVAATFRVLTGRKPDGADNDDAELLDSSALLDGADGADTLDA